jgi:hypothetical protein
MVARTTRELTSLDVLRLVWRQRVKTGRPMAAAEIVSFLAELRITPNATQTRDWTRLGNYPHMGEVLAMIRQDRLQFFPVKIEKLTRYEGTLVE